MSLSSVRDVHVHTGKLLEIHKKVSKTTVTESVDSNFPESEDSINILSVVQTCSFGKLHLYIYTLYVYHFCSEYMYIHVCVIAHIIICACNSLVYNPCHLSLQRSTSSPSLSPTTTATQTTSQSFRVQQ